jgi:hypothetical protein
MAKELAKKMHTMSLFKIAIGLQESIRARSIAYPTRIGGLLLTHVPDILYLPYRLTYIGAIHIFEVTDHQHRPLYHIQVSTVEDELNASTVCVYVDKVNTDLWL